MDHPSRNAVLPRLNEPATPAATVAIGVHFLAGGVILVLGCVRLISSVRARRRAVHRWLGRVYVVACLLAGPGGLGFIAPKGTVGRLVMDLGFSLYGVLGIACAEQAHRYARAPARRRWRAHPPNVKARVLRPCDAGRTWTPSAARSPDGFLAAGMRDAMTTDQADLYLGSRDRTIHASLAESGSWTQIAHLHEVLSLRVATV